MKRIKPDILVLGLTFFICFYTTNAFAKSQRPGSGAGDPYHLALADPELYQIKLYKAYLVKDDATEVTLYESSSGTTLNLVNGQFVPVADVNIPPGSYTQIKIITSRTFGIKGYCYFTDTFPDPDVTGYWYTKSGSSQTNIGFSTSVPTSAADYGTQTTTITDPGSGTEIGPSYEGQTTFIYTSNISLQIAFGQKPTIRIEFLADQYLELNDDDTGNAPIHSSPYAITFGAPTIDATNY